MSEICDAAKDGNLEKVKELLESGSDINERGENDMTPLHRAAEQGHDEIVNYLISKGADVNAEAESRWTPLHRGAYNNHAEVVRLLSMLAGVDVNARDIFGQNALHLAAQKGNEALIEHLIRMGVDAHAKDNNGDTPRSVALEGRNREVADRLP